LYGYLAVAKLPEIMPGYSGKGKPEDLTIQPVGVRPDDRRGGRRALQSQKLRFQIPIHGATVFVAAAQLEDPANAGNEAAVGVDNNVTAALAAWYVKAAI